MTTLSVPSRARWVTVAGIFGFAAALAAPSPGAISTPRTPVTATLRPLIRVLAGRSLGPSAAVTSMVLSVRVGAGGLPVFAPMGPPGIARFLSPTGGYLLAYPLAAFVTGTIAARRDTLFGRWLAACAGI